MLQVSLLVVYVVPPTASLRVRRHLVFAIATHKRQGDQGEDDVGLNMQYNQSGSRFSTYSEEHDRLPLSSGCQPNSWNKIIELARQYKKVKRVNVIFPRRLYSKTGRNAKLTCTIMISFSSIIIIIHDDRRCNIAFASGDVYT